MSSKVIGIDLGTTYSCLACWDETTGKAEVIPTASGRTMPSWVSFTSHGKLVGTAAKAQAASNSTNTVYDVKRILGRSFNDEVVEKERKHFPFSIIEGKHGEAKISVTWLSEKKELNPEQISAMVLSELKVAAEQHFGEKIQDAVITVPAHFNNQQRQATKDAGRIAGLNVRRIINEPTAAALAYGLDGVSTGNVVIFDLGGGTFDVTCLTMHEGLLEVKATGGDTHLGGEDFDTIVVKWCMEQLEASHGAETVEKLKKSNRAMSRLRRAVETGKRALSTAQSVDIDVDHLLEDVDFTAVLTRSIFEELNAELFQRCLDTVKFVLDDAQVTLEEVSDIVLVGKSIPHMLMVIIMIDDTHYSSFLSIGGSTRVPFLQSSLYDMFGGRIDLCKSVHPDEAVAIGAAVQGHILATGGAGGGQDLSVTTDLLLLDVTPLSLGIELEGRVMSTLIKRNTAIPCKKTRTYTTVEDWQTSIDVIVFEGERPCVDANNKLGSFQINGVERARAGEAKVDVTFALDSNGILSVSARDQVTQAEAKATIKAEKGRLSAEEVDRMIEEAERYRAQDEELATKTAYKAALEEALFTAQSKASGESDMIELEAMMDWLELDSDSATLEEMQGRGRILEDKYGILVSVQ
jgi:L1 cell adhesion molecule like protein